MIELSGLYIKKLRGSMTKSSMIIGYRRKKNQLARLIKICELEKIRTITFAQELKLKHLRREINIFEYEAQLNKTFKEKTPEDWIKYYEGCIKSYNQELNKYESLIDREQRKDFITPTLFVLILLVGSILIAINKPQLTGFVVLEPQNITNETLIQINDTIVNVTEIINKTVPEINATNLTTTEQNQTNLTIINIDKKQQKEAILAAQAITFDRTLECKGCGQHKAPPTTNVNMTIYVNGILESGTIIDYYPVDWSIIDSSGGLTSVYNSTFNKIEWNIENQTNVIKSYIIRSPQRTSPPTKYDFITEFNNIGSDPWFVIVSDPVATENVLWYITNVSNVASGINALISSTLRTNFTMNGSYGPATSFRVVGGANAVYYPLASDVISYPNQSLWDMNITSGILLQIYCNSTTNTAARRTRIDTANLTMFNILSGAVTSLGTTLGTSAGGSAVCPTGVLKGNTSTNITDTIADVVPYGFRLGTIFSVSVSSATGTAGSIIAWGDSANPSNVTFTWVPVNGFVNVTSINTTNGNINTGASFLFLVNLTCTNGRCGNSTINLMFNTSGAPTVWTSIGATTGINLTFTTGYTQNNPSYDCSNLSDSANTNENRTCAYTYNLTGRTADTYGLIANISWTNSTDNTQYNSTISSGIASQVASVIIISAQDTIFPLWNNSFANMTNVFQNMLVNFSSIFTDDIGLGNAVFSINLSGNYINSSIYALTNTFINISNVTRISITADQVANVTWFWFFNDTSGNSNVTILTSFNVDFKAPNFTNGQTVVNGTSFIQNQFYNFSSNWSDDTALDSYIFSINMTGVYVNSTSIYFGASLIKGTASNYSNISVSEGYNVTWQFWANDSSRNWNSTQVRSFVVNDTKVPIWISGSILKNQTTVLQNMYVNFSSNWTDNVKVDSFIFEINQSGSYKNSSSYIFGSLTGNVTTNITFVNASSGFNVTWRFWTNDTNNNWNSTGLDSFLVSEASQANKAPIIIDISAISSQSPTEASFNNVSFSFLVDDQDGTGNLSTTSAYAVFNVSSYTTQRTTTCGKQADINSTTTNFSCSIPIWYFDPAGNWSVIANISDNQNTSILIEQWNLSELTAMVFSPQSLTWPTIIARSNNQTSNNDPIVINNTGNGNLSQVRVQAINIHGLTTTTQFLPVANFTVYNNTGSGNPECNSANIATKLVNNTATAISGIGVYRGNNSASQGQQNLYFCIFDVPSPSLLTSQTYSTNNTGSWTISVV